MAPRQRGGAAIKARKARAARGADGRTPAAQAAQAPQATHGPQAPQAPQAAEEEAYDPSRPQYAETSRRTQNSAPPGSQSASPSRPAVAPPSGTRRFPWHLTPLEMIDEARSNVCGTNPHGLATPGVPFRLTTTGATFMRNLYFLRLNEELLKPSPLRPVEEVEAILTALVYHKLNLTAFNCRPKVLYFNSQPGREPRGPMAQALQRAMRELVTLPVNYQLFAVEVELHSWAVWAHPDKEVAAAVRANIPRSPHRCYFTDAEFEMVVSFYFLVPGNLYDLTRIHPLLDPAFEGWAPNTLGRLPRKIFELGDQPVAIPEWISSLPGLGA